MAVTTAACIAFQVCRSKGAGMVGLGGVVRGWAGLRRAVQPSTARCANRQSTAVTQHSVPASSSPSWKFMLSPCGAQYRRVRPGAPTGRAQLLHSIERQHHHHHHDHSCCYPVAHSTAEYGQVRQHAKYAQQCADHIDRWAVNVSPTPNNAWVYDTVIQQNRASANTMTGYWKPKNNRSQLLKYIMKLRREAELEKKRCPEPKGAMAFWPYLSSRGD